MKSHFQKAGSTLFIFLSFAISVLHAEQPPVGLSEDDKVLVVPRVERAGLPAAHEGESLSWISSKIGLAATVESTNSRLYAGLGRLQMWSLRTGLPERSWSFASRIRVVTGAPGSSLLLVAGGPLTYKDQSKPFACLIDAVSGKIVLHLPLPEGDQTGDMDATIVRGSIKPTPGVVEMETYRGNRYSLSFSSPGSKPRLMWQAPAASQRKTRDAAAPDGLPNWVTTFGASDELLALCAVGGQEQAGFGEVGVYRRDTWERIALLGQPMDPIDYWSLSHDGSFFVGLRRSGWGIVGDFRTLTITEHDFGPFFRATGCAFTTDGKFLRFARSTEDGRANIVSLDLISGVQHEWEAAGLSKLATPNRRGIAFSSNGRALALALEKELALFRFDNESPIPAKTGSLDSSEIPLAISDDGSRVWTGTSVEFYYDKRKAWISEHRHGGSSKVAWEIDATHPALWVANAGTTSRTETMMCRFNGPGMGPYGFGLRTRAAHSESWSKWPDAAVDGLAGVGVLKVPDTSHRELLVFCRDGGQVSLHDPMTQKICDSQMFPDYLYGGILGNGIAAPKAGWCLAPLVGGGMQLLAVTSHEKLERKMQVWSPQRGSWVLLLPDGRYAMSPGADAPVSFQRGHSVHPIEEFDLQLNQPAAVARALGAQPLVADQWDALRRLRAARLGVSLPTDVTADKLLRPAVSLRLGTPPPLLCDNDSITIHGVVCGPSSGQARLLTFVNDVPVSAPDGQRLAGTTQERPFEVTVPLGSGSNKIQLQVVDPQHGRSMFETFRVHRSEKGAVRRRLVLSIGISDYLHKDVQDLEFAAKDAADIAAALDSAPGRHPQTTTRMLQSADATKAHVLKARDFLLDSKPGDEVILFLAGHGVLDAGGAWFFCPTDFVPGRMQETGIGLQEIEGLLEGIPALNRLVLIDACHSGLVDAGQELQLVAKLKDDAASRGVRARPLDRSLNSTLGRIEGEHFRQSLGGVFLDLGRSTGATILSASSGMEFAMESDAHRNGLFTHCVVSAIHRPPAEMSKDGRITAIELVKHVAGEVARLSGGAQHPQARFTNLALDFVIASNPAGSSSFDSPEHLLHSFLRWSGGISETKLHPRLLSCFAPEVSYFGKPLSHTGLQLDNEQYNQRYPTRKMGLEAVHERTETGADSCRLRYSMSFEVAPAMTDSAKPGSSPGRKGILEMEVEMTAFKSEWKITSLKVLK